MSNWYLAILIAENDDFTSIKEYMVQHQLYKEAIELFSKDKDKKKVFFLHLLMADNIGGICYIS